MTTGEHRTIKDLYVYEQHAPGLVIVRKNREISSEERSDIVAQHRLDRLSAAIGQDATLFFTRDQILEY